MADSINRPRNLNQPLHPTKIPFVHPSILERFDMHKPSEIFAMTAGVHLKNIAFPDRMLCVQCQQWSEKGKWKSSCEKYNDMIPKG